MEKETELPTTVDIAKGIVKGSGAVSAKIHEEVQILQRVGVGAVAKAAGEAAVDTLAHVTGVSGVREGLKQTTGESPAVRVINTGLRAAMDVLFPVASAMRHERFDTGGKGTSGSLKAMVGFIETIPTLILRGFGEPLETTAVVYAAIKFTPVFLQAFRARLHAAQSK